MDTTVEERASTPCWECCLEFAKQWKLNPKATWMLVEIPHDACGQILTKTFHE